MNSPTAISERDKRVLIIGAIVVASLILFARGIPAWLSWTREVRAEAVETKGELARSEQTIKQAPVARDSLAARGERMKALAPALLSGDTPASAAATLAGLVSGAAASSGVRMGAVQVRPDSVSHDTFTRVAVRGDATGDIRGLTQMLLALERGPVLLAVRELSITQPEPGTPGDRAEVLRMELSVEGLMLNRNKGHTP